MRPERGKGHPVGNQTQWQYDALNRQILEIDPLYNISTMAYDAVDRVTSATDKNGQRIAYSYDLLNRETGETWIIGTITQNLLTFTFDPNNNMLTAANNTGTITRTYDSLDRLSTNAGQLRHAGDQFVRCGEQPAR